jgi:hypothetical protein
MQSAKQEREAALETAAIIRKAGRRQRGQATAAYAASGARVGEGSAAEVDREIVQGVEHDAFTAILEGDRRAMGLELDAKLRQIAGKAERRAGMINAVGTVLGGYAKFMDANGWKTPVPNRAPVEDRKITPLPTSRSGPGWMDY